MKRRGSFYRVRVRFLSSILALVCLWACYDVRARRARNEWTRPVRVGLVILKRGDVDQRALSSLESRVPVLAERLREELRRYRPDHSTGTIEIVSYGPLPVREAPPDDPGTSLWARAVHAFRLWSYTRDVDAAAQVPTHDLDSRIYVLAEPPRSRNLVHVEGFSEERGRIGVAKVELDLETVDLALFVAAHELLHTLGATDKYDAYGRTHIPDGLPEPELMPLFPQRRAEIMARNRVLSRTNEIPPRDLSELSVGRGTAEEIGWTE